jgi:putative flippase GtrA
MSTTTSDISTSAAPAVAGRRARAAHAARERLPHPTFRQFVKYVLVGGSNTAVDFAVYAALVLSGFPYVGAKVVAASVAMVNGYILNRRWTFRAGAYQLRTLARYVGVALGGLAVNVAVLVLLVEVLGVNKLLAQAIVIPFVALMTFAGNRLWTFGEALTPSK